MRGVPTGANEREKAAQQIVMMTKLLPTDRAFWKVTERRVIVLAESYVVHNGLTDQVAI